MFLVTILGPIHASTKHGNIIVKLGVQAMSRSTPEDYNISVNIRGIIWYDPPPPTPVLKIHFIIILGDHLFTRPLCATILLLKK